MVVMDKITTQITYLQSDNYESLKNNKENSEAMV